MTKETLGYVRLEWTCPNCSSRNPGPQKTCGSCGAAQPENVEFEQAAQEELVTDEAAIARAKAGPDVHCAFCGARNPAGIENCTQCGADLTEAVTRDSGRVIGAHRDKPAQPVPCPSCGAMNPASALECAACGAPLAPPTPEPRIRRRAAARSSPGGCSPVVWAVFGARYL
jgi:ribosomal protein L40E